MAQIIRLRRGTLSELNSVTLSNGELGVVTSSVASIGDAVLKTAVVVGNTDGTNRLSIARIITGNATPDLSSVTGGSNFNDMLYHETDAKTLLVLNSGGNTNLDLTGNIAGREIGGNVSGSSTSTGSFGYLNVDGDAVIGGNLTFGDANTDYVTFGADISSSLIPDSSDSFNLGQTDKRWNDLYLSGSISASGGPIDFDSATTVAIDSTTTTAINATTTLSAKGAGGASFGDDTGTWEFNGSGAVSETGMTTFSLTPSSTVDVDAGGAVTIDSSAAGISVGSDSVAQKITIGGDTSTRTEVELNAILVDINAGTNGVTIDAGASSNFTTSGGTVTVSGKTGVAIQEDGTDVIAIDTNQDVLFSRTGGATGDPDVEFDGYVRFDGITEVANTTTSTTSGTGALLVDGGIGVAENVNVGGNLTVTGNYTVNGTTTFISSSVVEIGDNIIQVNSVGPVRYGGIHVKDVNATETGSLVWDSSNDYWVAGQSGSEYRVPIQATVSDLTDNKVVIAQGNGRIESSANITDNGTTVDFNDVDLTSLDKLEGVDTNTYIDLGGSTLIVTKGTLQPSGHNGDDLGATGTRYKDLWLQGNADLEGDIDVNGTANLDVVDIDETLDVAGIADFQARVDAQSGLDVTGSLNSAGQISGLGGLSLENFSVADSSGNTDIDGTLDVQGVSDFQARVDAQSSLAVTGSIYVSAGASVAATSASLVSFRNDANTQFGYLASADTQAVTTGIVGYNASTGNLTISSVIDGGSF